MIAWVCRSCAPVWSCTSSRGSNWFSRYFALLATSGSSYCSATLQAVLFSLMFSSFVPCRSLQLPPNLQLQPHLQLPPHLQLHPHLQLRFHLRLYHQGRMSFSSPSSQLSQVQKPPSAGLGSRESWSTAGNQQGLPKTCPRVCAQHTDQLWQQSATTAQLDKPHEPSPELLWGCI